MDNPEFAERLGKIRREKGMSQKELGELLGVSNKAVSKWENGESMPKTATLLKLAEIFEIDGNELIGLDTVKSNEGEASAELDRLKGENAALRTRLEGIGRRRRKTVISLLLVLMLGIIAAVLIVFFFTDSGDKLNNGIKDAGSENTKITFSGAEYVPINALESYALNYGSSSESVAERLSDRKYADYVSSDGSSKTVLINAGYGSELITLSVKNKTHYYIDSEADRLAITVDAISSAVLSKGSISDVSSSSSYYSFANNTMNFDKNSEFVKSFCSFYADKGSPIDKSITDLYMGNSSKTLKLELSREFRMLYYSPYFSSDTLLPIGEFFTDRDGNAYYYDYIETQSYSVGKELSEYVYK